MAKVLLNVLTDKYFEFIMLIFFNIVMHASVLLILLSMTMLCTHDLLSRGLYVYSTDEMDHSIRLFCNIFSLKFP